MNTAETISSVMQVINASGCSPLANKICTTLLAGSDELTKGCYITLSSPTNSPFVFRAIQHAWRDIEDLAGGYGKLNEILTASGLELEFFAANGLLEGGKYINRVSSDTAWATYWLCKRSDQQKQDLLKEIPVNYIQLIS